MKKIILLFTLILSLTQVWSKNAETTIDTTCWVTVTQIQGGYCLLAEATGTAPFTYLWDNGSTSDVFCVNNPTGGGVYCVTMTDADGCVATACGELNPNGNTCSVWISQDSTGGNTGTELTAQPTGDAPFTYAWSTGELTQSIVVSQAGTYCVTITDANGCEASSCFTVDDDNDPNCSVFIENSALGALIAVANGTAPFTYAWSTNEATESIFPNAPGTYCVTITDAIGCEADACYYYGGNNDTLCWVTVAQIPGTWCLEATGYGTAPFTYVWENGDTGSTFCPNDPNGGTYCVTMVDANGCASTACGTLGNNNQDSCYVYIQYTNSGTLYASANPANGQAVTYLWSTGETTQSIIPPVPGSYCVTITTSNGCSAEDCVTVSFLSQIYGYVVTTGDSINGGGPNGTAYLIKYDPVEESLTAVDEVNFSQGYFHFDNVEEGNYLIKAALGPNSLDYEDFMPTYFDEVLWWNEATTLSVAANTTNSVLIQMVEGDNPGGPGFIGGLVSEGANLTGGADHRGDGDPLENVTMLLLDVNDNPVSHTVTNANGEYKFDNLAWGTYKVYIEIPGIEHVMYQVTIGPENPSVENLDFIVDEDSAATVSIKDLLNENSIEIFPNPANDRVNLQLVAKERAEVIFSMMSVDGQTIFAETVELYPGVYTHSFDMEYLPSGLYFINIIDGKESISRKVIKK